jgi:hypothetical protein
MVVCPSCGRHARPEGACPFCGAALPDEAPPNQPPMVTLYGAPPPRYMVRPAYGGPMRRRAQGKTVLLVFLLVVIVAMAIVLYLSFRGR